MATFGQLVSLLFDTETVIPNSDFTDIDHYMQTISEWNDKHKDRLLMVVPSNKCYLMQNFRRSTKKLTLGEAMEFINHFSVCFAHSYSYDEFVAAVCADYYKPVELPVVEEEKKS